MRRKSGAEFNLFHLTSSAHAFILPAMDTLIFRTRPNDCDECDQWTLVRDGDDSEDFIIQEHIVFGALLSGKPYARLIRRMTVAEFLATD
jgi:hypothetical protein